MLPQATKIAIPNLGSMFIGMIKDTSTFLIIGAAEITFHTNNLEQEYFQPFVLYTAAGAIYVIAAFIIDFFFRSLERAAHGSPQAGHRGLLRPQTSEEDRRRHPARGGRLNDELAEGDAQGQH